MSKFLFKAKRKNTEEWITGGTIVQFEDDGIRSFYMPQLNEKCDCIHEAVTDDILGFENCRFYKIDENTLCRFIGLYDKNKVKIWEKDIVLISGEEDYFQILWDDDKARFIMKGDGLTVDFDNYWSKETEVIGNVFDNSKLLEVSDEED